MKWTLLYSHRCSPRTKEFTSFDEAEGWAGRFLLENQANLEDNWVDLIIKGHVHKVYSAWAKEQTEKADEE